jgi:hypothetical protein
MPRNAEAMVRAPRAAAWTRRGHARRQTRHIHLTVTAIAHAARRASVAAVLAMSGRRSSVVRKRSALGLTVAVSGIGGAEDGDGVGS